MGENWPNTATIFPASILTFFPNFSPETSARADARQADEAPLCRCGCHGLERHRTDHTSYMVPFLSAIKHPQCDHGGAVYVPSVNSKDFK